MQQTSAKPASRFVRYTLVLFLGILATVLFPFPMDEATPIIRQAVQRSAPTMILGSSGIDESSRCESDRRSIPTMVSDQLGEPVIDASRNGLTVEAAVNIAAVVEKYRAIKNVVLAAGWVDLLETDAMSTHDTLAFRELNPELSFDKPQDYYHGLQSLFARYQHIDQPFTFRGVNYRGDVPGLFESEAKQRTCPENDGHNMVAIAANYYHLNVEYAPSPSLARLIVSLNRHLQAEQRAAVFVLLPLNLEYMGRIDSAGPGLIRQRRDALVAELRTGGVRVVDLLETLPSSDFIDRWCACTHYSAQGRMEIASQIAGLVNSVKLAEGQN